MKMIFIFYLKACEGPFTLLAMPEVGGSVLFQKPEVS